MSVEQQLRVQALENRAALAELRAGLAELRLDVRIKLNTLIAAVGDLRTDLEKHTHSK